MLCAGIVIGQTTAPAPLTVSVPLTTLLTPQYFETLSNGHYIYVVDDPRNLLRCEMGSINPTPSGVPTVYNIVCMQIVNNVGPTAN